MAVLTAPAGAINTYSTLDELKVRMGVSGTSSDGSLWLVLHAASRGLDSFCNRAFVVYRAARLFDVDDPAGFAVPDLAAVNALYEDADRDRVFEVARSASDYLMYPLNADPLAPPGRPYSRVVADPQGPRPSFTVGRSAVQLDGDWGFRSVSDDSGEDVASPLNGTSTTAAVTSGAAFAPGQTVRVGQEQMFVRQVSANNLTVARGVNGTTAASQSGGAGVYAFRPPPEVAEAALLLAARYWKRKDSAYGLAVGAQGYGPVRVAPGVDPDIEAMLSPFRRMPVGAGV